MLRAAKVRKKVDIDRYQRLFIIIHVNKEFKEFKDSKEFKMFKMFKMFKVVLKSLERTPTL